GLIYQTVYSSVLSTGGEQISIEDCCRDGQKRAKNNEDCSSIPLIFGSSTCMAVQEHCCLAVLEDNMCTTGINMAKNQGSCDSLFGNTCETKTTKMCCDCCLLGKVAHEQSLPCDHNLSVGHRCGQVSRDCCAAEVQLNQTTPTLQTKYIDECETGIHNCGQDFACQNTQGSFRCLPKVKCGAGFIQDRKHQEGFAQFSSLAVMQVLNINECVSHTSPCHRGQMCINTVGSYNCQRNSVTCGRGYHLSEDGKRCTDIDECKNPENVCLGHGCINMVGSYRCECQAGYVFNSIRRLCEDINECRHYPGRLCAHKCENTLGSYKCSCTTGFKLASDGRNCDDLNECESNPCSQECANVFGSYQCYCRRGYQLSDIDGLTCEDIDECALPTGGHICSYRCHNTPGSFHCSCPVSGYTLTSNGRSCQDVDECLTGTHTCTENQSCFNIQGGFRCLSLECPTNYRRVGETLQRIQLSDTIRCVKSCQPNDMACVLDPIHSLSHTVISLPTFREFLKPEEFVFLRTTVPAYGSYHSGSYDVKFDILEGNVDNAFDIMKRVENGMYVGVVRQVKPLIGPLSTLLKLSMRNVSHQGESGQNIINVHVFVSEFWF
uniref:Fibulin-1 n=1 Tax=Takifugu rubripes TaxID=31033 RepID=H2UYG2_TAKRU